MHPALLDTAFHASMLTGEESSEARTMLPFAWSGITLHAAGAVRIRIRVAPTTAGATIAQLTDHTGAPIVSVESVVARAATTARIGARREPVYRVDWVEVATSAAELDTVVVTGPHDLAALIANPPSHLRYEVSGEVDGPAGVHALTTRVLELVQSWLSEPALDGTRLVAVTRGAVSTGRGDRVTDLAAAAVWGLLRTAQSEHPGRVVLVDIDDQGRSPRPSSARRPPLLSSPAIRNQSPWPSPPANPRWRSDPARRSRHASSTPPRPRTNAR